MTNAEVQAELAKHPPDAECDMCIVVDGCLYSAGIKQVAFWQGMVNLWDRPVNRPLDVVRHANSEKKR